MKTVWIYTHREVQYLLAKLSRTRTYYLVLFSVLFKHSVVTDCFIHKGDGDTEVERVHRL